MAYRPNREAEMHKALQRFLNVKFRNEDTENYCDDFLSAWDTLRDKTRRFCKAKKASLEEYMLPEGTAKLMFFNPTLQIEWLRYWRGHANVQETNLEDLVRSLSSEPLPAYLEHGEQKCTRCKRHSHKNKDCSKQHPELR